MVLGFGWLGPSGEVDLSVVGSSHQSLLLPEGAGFQSQKKKKKVQGDDLIDAKAWSVLRMTLSIFEVLYIGESRALSRLPRNIFPALLCPH